MKKNSQVIKIIFSLAFFVQAFSIFAQASSSTINENNSSLSQVNTTNETQGSSMSTTASEKTVITIENAQSTTYEKDKDSGNDTIVLEGNVSVSVTKGATTTKVLAQKIVYDRNTQMLYASGGVSLEMTGGTTGASNASASSLMLNTATLEGVFDDGRIVQTQSDALNLPSGSTLIVASKMFGKSQKNTITFKNGSLTFCDDENPHWHIRASRIWLLPGGEFAFLNALLFVGPVPVFYLPAFYYPKDELVFNPVFSYDKRRGHSIQTTAYLYGRKPLDISGANASTSTSSSSDAGESLEALFNFMKPSTLKQQKLEGLVLHNLDENFTGDTTNYFKVMGDWYSNLGFLLGVDAVFKPNAYISNIVGKAQVAFTNTVVSTVDGYFPYYSNGKKHWDKSNFMGAKLPFRYGGEFSFSLSKPFS
ncbi:MAG: LPS-assembly protein LptD, partial [Treponema sp.]|nr:LPS-assembly protein LptD [Treponema sp.]